MKNTNKVLGFAAIIAVIALNALLFTGCPEPEPEGPALVRIEVTSQPTKNEYTVDDNFDITGIVVTAFYDDGTSKAVTGYEYSGYDKTTAGTQTITVTYEGMTATFTVTVKPKSILYVITGSGTSFTAKKGTATVGTAGPIQDVINAIRTDANGTPVTIQFGDGTAVLNIGEVPANFNTTGGTWGAITLTGKITSSSGSIISSETTGTVIINNNVSITSGADIANTSSGSYGAAIRSNSTGAVSITGGTLAGGGGYGVYNSSTGAVIITGGTIQTTGAGWGVQNNSTGTVNISGGTISSGSYGIINSNTGKITVSGTARITSSSTVSTTGAIALGGSATDSSVRLEISGGTVENTSTGNGNAIYNNSSGAINITGGTITKAGTNGYAILNNSTGVITVGPGATVTGQQKLTK